MSQSLLLLGGHKTNCARFDNSTSVVVHVGAENTTFNIPREPICKASGYFRAVFESGDFKETSEKALTLPDYEPETFDQFLSYVYNGRSVDTAPFDVLSAEEKWLRYSILYSLADYLQANRLKNSIVGILYRLCVLTNHNRKPSGITEKVIEYVFDNTVHGCGIRRLMVAQYIWGSKYEAFRQPEALEDLHAAMTGLHEDFLAELAAEAMRRVWDGKTRDPMKAGHRSFEDEEEVKLLSGKK